MSANPPLASEEDCRRPTRYQKLAGSVGIIVGWLLVGFPIVWLGMELHSRYIGFGLFAVISAPIIYWLMWREDFDGMASTWRYKKALKSRAPLSPQEFYEQFYRAAGIDQQIVEKFLNLTSEFWSVDRSLIRPDDNYCAMNGHDLDEEFTGKLREEFAVELTRDDRSAVDGSVDSVIRTLARLKRDAWH